MEKIKQIFILEKFPIPNGFTDEDIHFGAPRLFSDIFWVMYLNKMAISGLTGYALALTTSTREDIRGLFTHVNHSTIELYNKCTNLKLSKGIFVRPPAISIPDKVEFVQKQSFLTGWFGDRRPLNAIEISHMGLNLKKSILKQALFLGFAQVASSKKVRDYLTRAKAVVSTHIESFRSVLSESNLPVPPSWESEITNSTTPPFSDKLIMFHTQILLNYAIGYYGAGLAGSMRRDLGTKHTKAIAEDLLLAEDGANIMIENGWLEQTPLADNRKSLLTRKEQQ